MHRSTIQHSSLLITLVISVLCFAPAVFAQEATTTEPTTATVTTDTPTTTALSPATPTSTTTTSDTPRAELSDRAKNRIINLAANVSNRMDAAIERIDNIIGRVASRAAKLEEAGLDTTNAQAILASAQLSIDNAATNIADIDVVVNNAVNAEDPRAAWQDVRALYGTIQTDIRAAHAEVRAAVTALKAAVTAERPTTNTAPTNVPEPVAVNTTSSQ